MIEGAVNSAYEPIIILTLQGPSGQTREVKAVVDTGNNGFLTLPPEFAAELRLPFHTRSQALLANGAEVSYDVHGVTVFLDGHPRYIEADIVGPTPLVGMLLLDAYSLYVEIEPGGRVVIQPTSERTGS